MSVWLVTGANGQLGSHVVGILASDPANKVIALHSGLVPLNVPQLLAVLKFRCEVHYAAVDFSQPPASWESAIATLLSANKVEHIVHCAAICHVQNAFQNPTLTEAVNVTATKALAKIAVDHHCKSFTFCSTDMVFNGKKCRAEGLSESFYTEDDEPCPLSVYGKSKVLGEEVIREAAKHAAKTRFVIARLCSMFGAPHLPGCTLSKYTFAQTLRQLASTDPKVQCVGFTDEFRTPLSYHTAAKLLLKVAITVSSVEEDNKLFVFHIAGHERLSRFCLLEKMRSALANVLLGNEMSFGELAETPRALTGSILRALGRGETLEDDSGVGSPTTMVRQCGSDVLDKVIAEGSRDKCGASEPRPEDLSLSNDKVLAWLAGHGVEVAIPALDDELAAILQRWINLVE